MTDESASTLQLKTEVYCSLQVEGTHCWPNCPYDEVAYLRDPHRHVFFIKAYAEVTHNDRDLEFIMLKHRIAEFLHMRYYNETQHIHTFGAMSCEMLGELLVEAFGLTKCDVSEDNENGSVVTKC